MVVFINIIFPSICCNMLGTVVSVVVIVVILL
uniref:Uncharacterized protein n=1 Tax=Anguilla anguilla TaxID=7936 RepID=A0A0E9VBB9_ANGAN